MQDGELFDSTSGENRRSLGLPQHSTQLQGNSQKVSVTLPTELADSVRARVSKGEFSHYLAEALALKLEMDLLRELDEQIDERRGTPIPEHMLEEAESAWPDVV